MGLGLRKQDSVQVLSGKNRGKRGKLLRLNPDGTRGFVEGVNLVKRLVRRSRKNPQGGVVLQESSIHLSNLALICRHCSKKTRIKNRILADRTKIRICAHCDGDLSPQGA